MFRILTAALALTAALPALAQEVPDQRAAKGQLFGTRGSEIAVYPHAFLSEVDVKTLQAMPKVAGLKYYGALAAAPAAGLQHEASTGAFNYHSVESAREAAIAGCNAKRPGGAACVIVAEVLPRRYEAGRALTLNQDASAAVDGREFGRAGPDAALAISLSTGSWGLGNGAEAAIAACAASAGAGDCVLAVAK